jgi:serine protease Do
MTNQLSPEKYIIRYLSGSKANQIEEFNFNKLTELTFGRSENSIIHFDPDIDASVSREHGKIVLENANTFAFKIFDNESKNGIYVNKKRISGSQSVNFGDEVQLGSNGPVFIFDVTPRPKPQMMPTREINISPSKPTAEIEIPSMSNGDSSKIGVGKQTIERMIVTERKKNYGTMAAVLGGLVLLFGSIGYAYKDKIFPPPAPVINQVTNVTDSFNPASIASQNRKKVVQFEFAWRLYSSRNNEPLYHEFTMMKDAQGKPMIGQNGSPVYVALYVQTSDGKIEPKLTSDQNALKIPIGISGASGSGFVVSNNGFILTNRHVATNWKTRYGFPDFCFPGLLVSRDGKVIPGVRLIQSDDVFGWVPGESKQLGEEGVVGRNTYLNVIFADSDQRIPVSGEPRPSDEHDVALVKVDVPGDNLPFVTIDENVEVKEGEQIVVMGYPGVTPTTFTVTNSKDVFNSNQQFKSVAKPTTTPGNVGAIHSKSGGASKDIKSTYSEFGDAYQLTVNATGGGNSGGPMFNKDGKVIGIFFAGKKTDAQITFAVPIKYGKKLFSVGN